MIKISFIKLVILSLTLLSFAHSTEAAQKPCTTIVSALENSTAEDWGQLPPSLKPLLLANISLLLGVEGVRGLAGWEHAFSSQFFVNTPLDSALTVIAHTIAIGRAPQWLKNLTSGRLGYFARASTNTIINTLVILAFWKSAALAQGKTITAAEAGSALGLCTAFYFCIQYIKNKVFVQFPRKLDANQLNGIRKFMGENFVRVLEVAQNKGSQLEISKEDVDLLLLSTFDQLLLTLPYEERILLDSKAPPTWKALAGEIATESATKSKEKLRRKLIWKILNESEMDTSLQVLAEDYLHLGDPLTPEQSMQIHFALKSRYWRNKVLVGLGALGDQAIGVVLAGGILLRGLTQQALTN